MAGIFKAYDIRGVYGTELTEDLVRDIARAAGVSPGAASVALNGGTSRIGVSAATRKRVREAAARLGYRLNAAARATSTGRYGAAGIFQEDNAGNPNFFFRGTIQGPHFFRQQNLHRYASCQYESNTDLFQYHNCHCSSVCMT